ncbi:uncharacterized protein LOC105392014 isoform X1 [Plutella xylostella]|uniref:uncharacterized protein LOC105392014 isoform X1 n=2 Tax=Plutella xylostella TaxID=51655 RepID=UPI002032441A|nr:uncharacterized protein LOC105392014 isoform X1 [Plutella xylostella]XP_037973298.2 uncharacterized protein LOC105392014 isoform X1 [Plutella xylostella]XP_037973346.2 uncharacterized protein LOC105392014 isoform X1 [Plutella xylostella]
MQSARESGRQKRSTKRRNSRKKSLSPSDLKCSRGDTKTDPKTSCKRSLSEGSVKHRKSNIRRTMTHPFTTSDGDFDMNLPSDVLVKSGDAVVPESDESNLPPTSSDRDTEDDARSVPVPRVQLTRPRWDSGSEMDSLVSTVVKRASARRRKTPVNLECGVSSEAGEASESEAGRMRPEDYRLVFLSSDSSCREDTEDSSSTASSAAPPVPDDCDWDYFEPGAAVSAPTQAAPGPTFSDKRHNQPCPRPCSCGAEPRIVAVPVPVPVPIPAALWPSILAYPTQTPPTPHWSTYPGFPNLDAAAFARFTTAAAVAVTAAAANSLPQNKPIEMTTVEKFDKASQSETSHPDNGAHYSDKQDKQSVDPPVDIDESDNIKVITEEDRLSVVSGETDTMPGHLQAEHAFPSSDESANSSDSEGGVARRSYDLTSGNPEEPATTDEDSDDSGGGGGGAFSRVFVVNPADSSSDMEDNADSSGIDCDDSYDKKSDDLEIIAEVEIPNNLNIIPENHESDSQNNDNSDIVLVDSVSFSEEYPMISCSNDHGERSDGSPRSNFKKFCDENMLQSEICETYNSFNLSASSSNQNDNLDSEIIEDSSRTISLCENNDLDSISTISLSENECNKKHTDNNVQSCAESGQISCKLSPSPVPEEKPEQSPLSDKNLDLFKGIERKLSELLMKESLDEPQQEEKLHEQPVCTTEGGASAPAATVCRSRTADADGSARFTSRVMITHDRVSVVTSDTTRLMRDITVHHTNSQNISAGASTGSQNENDERISDDESQPSGGVTVVSNADTLSAVVCLEEGLADDDSWVEDVSHDEDATSPSDSDSGDEASLPTRGEEFSYCRRSLDFTLHTIVEESCEESEAEPTSKKQRPISATELEKYFFFGLGDGRTVRDEEDEPEDSETSSVCSEGDGGSGAGSIVDNEKPEHSGDNDELVSSRLEKYFLSGFMGFSQERQNSDGSESVGSDSEGKQSPEHRRKRLVRARGTPRSHSSSLDNLLTGEEPSADVQEVSDGSSTETEERHDSSERLDMQNDSKRKKQNKKTRGSPADERRLSTEFTEEAREDTRSVSEGEDGRLSPLPEFPPLGCDLSESKKQTSRDSGFVGSCDDLLRNGDSSSDFARSHEPKTELEEIVEEIRPDIEERIEPPRFRPMPTALSRKDSFNNWSSDEETNLMMTKMRQFFKQMVASNNVRTSTPASSNSESSKQSKPPQLLYFESELTRLMKTVPGIKDEEVREIVEYLSSEDTWSDSYDSSDYAGSDLESSATKSALRRQISESCREIIDEFDRGNCDAGSLERDAAGAYQRLAATLGRAGEGSPPLFGKVMRHIGGRLVALMHEVSAGASASTDDDSASEPGALARSRSDDILEAAASRGSVASDSERFSWRGSFESALLAADSRGTLRGVGCEARRSPAGVELAAQRSHSRSCGAISGSEDRLWRGRRRASAPDAESEEEQRSGSLPRLPSVVHNTTAPAGPVKSARYRAPGFRTATRAASAPGLHAPKRRRQVPTAPHQPSSAGPGSAPSLQDESYVSENLSPGHATLPRRSNSPSPHERDLDRDSRFSLSRSGLQNRSESMASVYSGAGEGTRASVMVKGEVQFSLLYNYRMGALEVGVRQCRDLASVDTKKNRSDPYVKVYLLPDKSKAGKRKTKVKKNTLNPVFDETLSFVQPLASLSARTLWLSVWHADMFGRNDFLGEVTLPLADVVFDDPAPTWYKLQERTEIFDENQGTRGDLIIGLKFELQEPTTGNISRNKGTLHVLVKEAKNLVATKPSGTADVFCKSYLLPERGRLAKQKTNVSRRTLSPRWEHTFTYRGVTLQELGTRALELSLWDRDRLASNEFMGAVRLSLGTGAYMGASVNWMDSSGKEVTLWQTMMQRPNFWVEGSLALRPQLSS